MSSHDPTVTRVALPASLVPQGQSSSVERTGGDARTVPASTGEAAPNPKSVSTLLEAVQAICEKAQTKAFPGVSASTNVQATTNVRQTNDYQNNSSMALFGIFKRDGAMPEGIKGLPDVAQRLAQAMRECDADGIFQDIQVAGGFINIWLSREWQAARVQDIVLYGALPPNSGRKRVVVDFSSPNVAKEMHVGHLRSTILGDTICRILEFCGHEVERVNHVGDWGTQFGMLIAHLKDVFPDFATKPPPIKDLQAFYKSAKKVFDTDEAFKTRAHQEVVRLQGGDGASRFAWQQICDVSRREFEKVYSRLQARGRASTPHSRGVTRVRVEVVVATVGVKVGVVAGDWDLALHQKLAAELMTRSPFET